MTAIKPASGPDVRNANDCERNPNMLIKSGTLVIVADGSKMMLFKNDGNSKNPVLATLAHAEIENPAASSQGTDTPGRSFSSLGRRRSSYSETDWHRQAQESFAALAEAELEKAAALEQGGIVVIAPPRTLGELRMHYGKRVKQQLLAEIPKDLAGHVTDDIVEAIGNYKV
jgi:protein required for attachment to host cells